MNSNEKNENTSTVSTLELAYESIDSSFGYIDYIISKISFLVEQINKNELNAANQSLIEVIDLMDLYIQLISKVYQVIRLNQNDQVLQDQNIQKLEIHLLSVIKALLVAKEKNDLVMLCDLLEYELVDNLTQWKIKVLPELKKSKNI
jgi:CII-binding regulator of phage lambda lysogenization HflD